MAAEASMVARTLMQQALSPWAARMPTPEPEGPALHERLEDRLVAIEQQVHGLYEQAPFGAYCTDINDVYTSINATQLHWMGLPAHALLGKHRHDEFLTAESREYLCRHASLYGRHGFAGLKLELLDANGQTRARDHDLDADGRHRRQQRRPALHPVRPDRRTERLKRQRIAALAFDAAVGICITDAGGAIVEANEAFCQLTGYSIHELRGQHMSILHIGAHEANFYAAMWATVQRHGLWQGEVRDRRKDGSEFIAWLSLSTIRNQAPERSHHVGILYDITRAKARDAEISHLAFFDPLTQLPNRRLLQDRLEQALLALKRNALHGALLFVDMDNFADRTADPRAENRPVLRAGRRAPHFRPGGGRHHHRHGPHAQADADRRRGPDPATDGLPASRRLPPVSGIPAEPRRAGIAARGSRPPARHSPA